MRLRRNNRLGAGVGNDTQCHPLRQKHQSAGQVGNPEDDNLGHTYAPNSKNSHDIVAEKDQQCREDQKPDNDYRLSRPPRLRQYETLIDISPSDNSAYEKAGLRENEDCKSPTPYIWRSRAKGRIEHPLIPIVVLGIIDDDNGLCKKRDVEIGHTQRAGGRELPKLSPCDEPPAKEIAGTQQKHCRPNAAKLGI